MQCDLQILPTEKHSCIFKYKTTFSQLKKRQNFQSPRQQNNKGWKKRWVVFDGNELRYYKDKVNQQFATNC